MVVSQQELGAKADGMGALVPDKIVMYIVGWNNLRGSGGRSIKVVDGIQDDIRRIDHTSGLHALSRVAITERIDQNGREDRGQAGGEPFAVVQINAVRRLAGELRSLNRVIVILQIAAK